jgi:thioesterase domain-containing protein
VVLDKLPLTPNGKLDRTALPAPDHAAIVSRPYEEPASQLEHAIAQIWQEMLDVAHVGRHDNFFELGGHSLLAVRMVHLLHKQFNLRVTLRDLFEQPTLQGFAGQAEREATSGGFRSLVPIRATGHKRPLFLVHPSKGEIGYVYSLARWLDKDLPVYGLAAEGLAADRQPLHSIEEMAALYISEIRQVQPRGPYRIGGWSSGGIVAYEMANQLAGADERVEFLGLIDTHSHHGDGPADSGASTAGSVVAADVDQWILSLVWLPESTPDSLRSRLAVMAAAGDTASLFIEGQQAGLLPNHVPPEVLRRYMSVQFATRSALRHYVRPDISIPMHLFFAADERRSDPTIGWRSVAGNRLKLIPVPGLHLTMMDVPHVKALATAIESELKGLKELQGSSAEQAYSPCILIKLGKGGAAPLFCIPGAGASITAFTELADALPARMPVYGMQPRGLCGNLAPHIDVPSAARAYVRAMREVQPRGPYRLLGHSFGGWVALEMAHQLREAGEEAASLTVLDSMPPDTLSDPGHRYSPAEILQKLIGIYEQSLGASLDLVINDLTGANAEAQLGMLLSRLIQAGLMPRSTPLKTLKGIFHTFSANVNTRYVPPEPHLGESCMATCGTAEGNTWAQAQAFADVVERWRHQLPGLQVFISQGNHMSMLREPHAQEIAAWLAPMFERPR